MSKNKTKILLFDIETSPNLGYAWGKYEQDILSFKKEWYILSFAYKWLGEKEIKSYALPDFEIYKKEKDNDIELLKKLWSLLNECEIAIGQNLDEFDIKKINTRFLAKGMAPPSPYKTIDTLKVAKKYFSFNSNKLNDLSEYLGIGKKIDTGGFELWLKCLSGDMKSWKKLKKYNVNDVFLLEKVYLLFRPWISNHPNKALMDGKERACPTCGSEKVQSRGFTYTRVGKYRRWQCLNCRAWSQSKIAEKEIIKTLLK